eukprot:SAG31_NODE_28749_length_405_cov_1.339869_1_plen_62_part_10
MPGLHEDTDVFSVVEDSTEADRVLLLAHLVPVGQVIFYGGTSAAALRTRTRRLMLVYSEYIY